MLKLVRMGLSEKLTAKLTHIALKEGQGFNAHPACPRQLLAPLLHSHDGLFWPTCRQLVQDRQDDSEVVASLSEQDHHAQAAHLLLVIEAVAAGLEAEPGPKGPALSRNA